MINTQVIKSDFIVKNYTTAFVLNQHDKGIMYRCKLFENNEEYTINSSDLIYIEWKRADGETFKQTAGITKGANYIDFSIQEFVTGAAGIGIFNVICENGDIRKGTLKREYEVIATSI